MLQAEKKHLQSSNDCNYSLHTEQLLSFYEMKYMYEALVAILPNLWSVWNKKNSALCFRSFSADKLGNKMMPIFPLEKNSCLRELQIPSFHQNNKQPKPNQKTKSEVKKPQIL